MTTTSKLKYVTTAFGKTVPLKNCRKILGEYYEKGTECIQIGEKWYRTNSEKICMDMDTKEYVLRTNYVYGMDKKGQMGWFKPDFRSVMTNQNFYIRNVFDSLFNKGCVINNYGRLDLNKPSEITYKNPDNSNLPYEIDKSIEFASLVDHSAKHAKVSKRWKINRFLPKLCDYTFGVEYETVNGYLTSTERQLCLSAALKDGSLHGGMEYATIPLSSKEILGVNAINMALHKMMSHYDQRCSLHVHVGNFNKSRVNVVSLYLLVLQIQHQLLDIFAPYRKNAEYISNVTNQQHKDYCSPLPNLGINKHDVTQLKGEELKETLDHMYYNIVRFCMNNHDIDAVFNTKTKKHPAGKNKWDRKNRYMVVNFLNLFFGYGTVEFRSHPMTNNHAVSTAWIMICAAIVKYAEENTKKILSCKSKILLSDILEYFYNTTGLIEYYELNQYVTDLEYSLQSYQITNGTPVTFAKHAVLLANAASNMLRSEVFSPTSFRLAVT